MRLSLFTDCSLRILMFAAVREQTKFSVDEVAEAYGLSRHHTAKAVNFLTQTGYLDAKRGRNGGIRLRREPREIVVGRLVRQTETGAPLIECFDPASNSCPLIEVCLLKGALAEAWAAFFRTLDEYTLADLVRQPNALRRALEPVS
jgi:Rrf2 family nitric oxide-sensitive transcriptional repressor